jgi:hypothetical protein
VTAHRAGDGFLGNLSLQAVPEPDTAALVAFGLFVLVAARRRARRTLGARRSRA